MASVVLRNVVVFVFLFVSSGSFASGGRRSHVFTLQSLHEGRDCTAPKGNGTSDSTRLPVAHAHGPCSPLRGIKCPSTTEILDKDQLRVDYLIRRISMSTTKATTKTQESKIAVPAFSGSLIGSGNYMIIARIGTPFINQTVIFDTGSDVCWIQCKPCISCYAQEDSFFDPSSSTSYQSLPCKSTSCTAFDNPVCAGTDCGYSVTYGDGSNTTGTVGIDTLVLGSNRIDGFYFGCGQDNEGLFNGSAGLFGLGRGSTSLISQTAQIYDNGFSYCLPSATSSSTGFLNLGGYINTNSITYTPMLQLTNNPSFYSLTLNGISVHGRLLSVPPAVFSTVPTIIDSGTVITRLPPTAYRALRSVFISYMSAYPPTVSPVSIFDTCFDFSTAAGGKIVVPNVALHFAGGAAMDLDFTGIIYFVDERLTQGCLAFAETVGTLIIGNAQQSKFEVVYDIGLERIGFSPNAC